MKRTLRGLGIGLFLAGVLLYLNTNFTIPYIHADTGEKKYKEQITKLQSTIDAQKIQIEELSTKEVPKSADVESKKPSGDKTVASNVEAEESKQPETTTSSDVIKATLYIYEDMSLYNVGQQAQDLGLVKVGRELELYLSNPTYAKYIQKGAFELRSDMTYEEMAKMLTGKSKDTQ